MNESLYNAIEAMMEDGITHQEIEDTIKQVQEKRAKAEGQKKLIIARECLINALLQYCNILGISAEMTSEDINEYRKSLVAIEDTITKLQSLRDSNPELENLKNLFDSFFGANPNTEETDG